MKNSDGSISLILFDCDLRISDNPAFFEAAKSGDEILPIFILDEKNKRVLGETSKWFLHFVLENFSKNLREKFALNLLLKKGDSLKILKEIFAKKKVAALYFNKAIEPYNIKLHEQIIKLAAAHNIEVFSFKAQTLFEPEEIKNGEGSYFKVFTAFWNKCLKNSDKVLKPLAIPSDVKIAKHDFKNDDLDLLPEKKWAKKFEKIWEFDEKKVRKNFTDFLQNKIHNYKQARDIPSLEATSKLSPYLHFGVISPREIFNLTIQIQPSEGQKQFLAEIGWREFSHHLLFHFPQLPTKSFRAEFEKFSWQENDVLLKKWQKGQTGYPIVDAGMRELWATGLMHNRVRMVVASFLIKHLLIDWREGEKWFWNCLVDANLANNTASWQWVAGSGADAAPYFRIFNPSLQGERFDVDGKYVRKWVPEISKLPNKFIHEPWKADKKTLEYCGVALGENYPEPIVDHAKARDMAMMLYKMLKS
jgi:deoxyribodipyrimidine photo-lyase